MSRASRFPSLESRGLAILAALTGDGPTPAGSHYRGIFLPSFHPETLITVALARGRDAEVVCATFESNLESALARRGAGADATPPARIEARAPIDAARAEQLRRSIDDMLAAGLADASRGCGIDGMSLLGIVARDAAPPLRFEAWSPRPGDPRHTYFAALHAVAREHLPDPRVQQRLGQLHGYLGLGLPVLDLGGTPRHLRIFGHLSIDEEAALREFLAAPPPTSAVLVDLLDFEGMGTMLYPLLRRFDRRPGPVAWVASPGVRRMLLEAGVAEARIVADLASARARLGGA